MNSGPTQNQTPPSAGTPPTLERGLGVVQATALNISNMIGIGPFITIPIFIAAMGGPQAMIGWVVAAVLVLCDGLIWSELGAALPGSGGTYHYLKQIFARYRWGGLPPFLFIWQFLIGGPLELASGYIGAFLYLKYALPGMAPGTENALGALSCLVVAWLLSRRIKVVGWMAVALCVGTLITVFLVIGVGLTHFDASLLRPPPNAFHFNLALIIGLGAAMRIAIYDFLGYYNICHLGDEVRDPARTIPRAIIISVVVVAVLYLVMNVSIIAVVPWQEAMKSENIAALFMERLFGRNVAVVFTGFIIWTAFACIFSMTLGYSRIPYAAARAGDFFKIFGELHPEGHYPSVSLLAITGLTAVFCFLPLDEVINAAVTVRILIQFVGQIIALHVLHTRQPEKPLPFRMWFYPIPSLLALIGWIFMWVTSGWTLILGGLIVLLSGIEVYIRWQAMSGRKFEIRNPKSETIGNTKVSK